MLPGLVLAFAAAQAAAPPPVKNPAQHKAQAPSPGIDKIGGAEGWEAYTDTARNQKICYLMGEPAKSEPSGAKRGKVFVSVTHRPNEKTAGGQPRVNEIGFNAGYLFKDKTDAELLVDGKKFALFTDKDTAWAQEGGDKAVVDALAKGKQAIIKGISARGTATTDIYSLAGFSKALDDIDKACGVRH